MSGRDVPPVVTIDGAAGSGKSTLARGLATALGLPYINTGSMYRHLTLVARRRHLDLDDGPALAALMDEVRFTVQGPAPGELWIDDDPPSPGLYDDEVETHVSNVARHPEVRAKMRELQRALGADGAVMEGRDIGSVVFSDAPVKLHLQAPAQARAARRGGERRGDRAHVARALHDRDRRDARTNPLDGVEGADSIDTGDLDIDQSLARALAIVRARAPQLLEGMP